MVAFLTFVTQAELQYCPTASEGTQTRTGGSAAVLLTW